MRSKKLSQGQTLHPFSSHYHGLNRLMRTGRYVKVGVLHSTNQGSTDSHMQWQYVISEQSCLFPHERCNVKTGKLCIQLTQDCYHSQDTQVPERAGRSPYCPVLFLLTVSRSHVMDFPSPACSLTSCQGLQTRLGNCHR